MAQTLQRVVREPAATFEHLKDVLLSENPSLQDPLTRTGCEFSCVELFGQSTSIRDGFGSRGAQAVTFDYRSSILLKATIPTR